ncbi:MAG TPA: hypothetical protein PKK60_03105 [archaeon]|nr:hypothetical protein [archaeon]
MQPRKVPLNLDVAEKKALQVRKKATLSNGFKGKGPGIWGGPIINRNGRMINKFHTIIHTDKKTGKRRTRGLLAISFDERPFPGSSRFNLVYYPLPKHMKAFSEAISKVKKNGPSLNFPGSVGSIEADVYSRGKTKIMNIHYIQAHYKTSQHGHHELGLVTREMGKRYGGWRKRALQELFGMAKKEVERIQYVDSNPEKNTEFAKSIQNRHNEFKEIAEANGYHVLIKPIMGSKNMEIIAEK